MKVEEFCDREVVFFVNTLFKVEIVKLIDVLYVLNFSSVTVPDVSPLPLRRRRLACRCR